MVLRFSREAKNSFFPPPDTLFTAFVATVQKIITYALGAHDPGSAQDGKMTSVRYNMAFLVSPPTAVQKVNS